MLKIIEFKSLRGYGAWNARWLPEPPTKCILVFGSVKGRSAGKKEKGRDEGYDEPLDFVGHAWTSFLQNGWGRDPPQFPDARLLWKKLQGQGCRLDFGPSGTRKQAYYLPPGGRNPAKPRPAAKLCCKHLHCRACEACATWPLDFTSAVPPSFLGLESELSES